LNAIELLALRSREANHRAFAALIGATVLLAGLQIQQKGVSRPVAEVGSKSWFRRNVIDAVKSKLGYGS